jgi:putative transposase
VSESTIVIILRINLKLCIESQNRMSRKTSPSFVLELPLKISSKDERVLNARFQVARQVYNACLGEGLRRLKLKRESKAYQTALHLPKGEPRQAAFAEINRSFGFREYALHDYAGKITTSWMKKHLDSHVIQTIASRAFKTVQHYAFGTRGKPRFKGLGQLHSIESKTDKIGIRWRDNCVEWLGLELPALIDHRDKVVLHGLASPVKYVRLLRRKLNGKNRFYVQLILEGKPYQKARNILGKAKVGLDLGPSTIAAVSEHDAFLLPFCAELNLRESQIRRLQRKLERQRRINNPDNYAENGTIKAGKKTWLVSNHMQKTRQKIAESHRKIKEHRASLQGKMVNRVLRMGQEIQLEKISYRTWQKMFGRSVARQAPGLFVSLLKRKAASAGVLVQELSTQKLKLSQVCHACGAVKKKPLSQRWHNCECGIVAQRDLYSAFLAVCVEDNRLNVDYANTVWSGVETLLRVALSGQRELAKEEPLFRSVVQAAPE